MVLSAQSLLRKYKVFVHSQEMSYIFTVDLFYSKVDRQIKLELFCH